MAEDPSESHDLAAAEPERLRALQELWWQRGGTLRRAAAAVAAHLRPRPAASPCGRASASCCGRARRRCPRSWRRNVKLRPAPHRRRRRDPRGGAEGVLVAQGGRFGGFSLYVHDGRLHYTTNFAGIERTTVSSPQPLAPGRHVVGVALEPAGGMGMRAELLVGGDVVAGRRGAADGAVPLRPRRRGPVLRLRRRHARGGRLRVAVRLHRHDPRGDDRRLGHAGRRSGGRLRRAWMTQ